MTWICDHMTFNTLIIFIFLKRIRMKYNLLPLCQSISFVRQILMTAPFIKLKAIRVSKQQYEGIL